MYGSCLPNGVYITGVLLFFCLLLTSLPEQAWCSAQNTLQHLLWLRVIPAAALDTWYRQFGRYMGLLIATGEPA
jgi:hypothetical protein